MATTLKPFITVVRPSSKGVGSDETKLEVFERLFEKWKRKQERERKLEKKKKKSRELEPFDFQNPPKVLEIKPIKLQPKNKSKKPCQTLPSIVHKATLASQAKANNG